MTSKPLKIASLACSYNRKDKTGTFLKSLFAQALPEGYTLDIYLLDDNSADGTAEMVKNEFPAVKLIKGTGSLYWAGAMRTVWNAALKNDDYDFFILLNDDVHLFDNAISRLLAAHKLSRCPRNIILGTVQDSVKKTISYGGHKMRSRVTGFVDTVTPDDKELTEAHTGNANVMLVDKATVDKIGVLSKEYIHGLADFDYTLVALKNDGKVWVAPGYYGYCVNDHGKGWVQGKSSFKKRLAYLYSPTGLAYKEYMHYVWKHYPLMLPGVFIKAWAKTLFPGLYDKYKK